MICNNSSIYKYIIFENISILLQPTQMKIISIHSNYNFSTTVYHSQDSFQHNTNKVFLDPKRKRSKEIRIIFFDRTRGYPPDKISPRASW